MKYRAEEAHFNNIAGPGYRPVVPVIRHIAQIISIKKEEGGIILEFPTNLQYCGSRLLVPRLHGSDAMVRVSREHS